MFSSLRNSLGELFASPKTSRQRHSCRSAPKRPRALRCFERLEDRRVLASVSTQAALIAAINSANAAGGNNTITLTKNITLFESTPDNDVDGPTGLPLITAGDHLTINGNGHTIARSTEPGNADFRFFEIGASASLTLKNLTLTNGLVNEAMATHLFGGAIFVEPGATLALNAVLLTGNSVNNLGNADQSTLAGGAIYNSGMTSITSSVISGNSATFAFANPSGQGDSQGDNQASSDNGNQNGNGVNQDIDIRGGGIFNAGTLTVSASLVSNNVASCQITNGAKNLTSANGNGDLNGNSDSAGDNGNFNGNGVVGNILMVGGGIANLGTATLTNDTISGNRAVLAITNGSNNGDNNGDKDSGDNNGDNNGNGLTGGNVSIYGGGIYNSQMFSATRTRIVANSIRSTVTNGNFNGNGNGQMTENFNGNENGNGVDGNITLSGGGLMNDQNATALLSGSIVSGNSISTSIANGNNNGDNDGVNNAGLGNNEGKNNGNGVAGFVHASGGGIDNETGASLTIASSIVLANSIHSAINNGSNNGNMDGNNDGNGDALASVNNSVDVLFLQGAGIRNDGDLTVTSAAIAGNFITSTIHNGNNDGDNNGDNNAESNDGRANGNAVSGGVLFAGGGIANSDMMTLTKCILAANLISSSIANGNNNGNNDGQNDGAHNNCGINCGDGVFGAVEIEGGGIDNSGTAALHSSTITGNFVGSTVTNGNGNGQNDGTGSTGADGQGDGNGVDGDVMVVGGGTANPGAGTLTLTSTTVAGNFIHSGPTTGSGDTTLDGQVVNGAVTVSGTNSF
jgi:hypothetical protein